MRGTQIARATDPPAGVRNKRPKPRHARWSGGEAVWLSRLGVHHCCGMGHAVLPNRRAHTGCQTPSARGREQATPAAVIANRPPPPAAMNRPPTPSPAAADLSSGEEVHRSERQADLRLGTSQAISICALSRITALDAAEGGWKSAWYVINHGKVLRPCDVDRWLAQMVPNMGGQTVLTPLSQCRAVQPRQRRRLAYHRRPRPAPGRTRAPPRPRGGG